MDITLTEEWKAVVGFEGRYEVSNYGRVRSLDRIVTNTNRHFFRLRGKIMTQTIHESTGYPRMILRKNGKSLGVSPHRLVAIAFIPNPDNLPVVNHVDAVKTNNVVTNLEWCTHRHNTRHAQGLGRLTAPPLQTKLSDHDVVLVRRMCAIGISNSDIAKVFDVSQTLISIIASGKHRVTAPQQEC